MASASTQEPPKIGNGDLQEGRIRTGNYTQLNSGCNYAFIIASFTLSPCATFHVLCFSHCLNLDFVVVPFITVCACSLSILAASLASLLLGRVSLPGGFSSRFIMSSLPHEARLFGTSGHTNGSSSSTIMYFSDSGLNHWRPSLGVSRMCI